MVRDPLKVRERIVLGVRLAIRLGIGERILTIRATAGTGTKADTVAQIRRRRSCGASETTIWNGEIRATRATGRRRTLRRCECAWLLISWLVPLLRVSLLRVPTSATAANVRRRIVCRVRRRRLDRPSKVRVPGLVHVGTGDDRENAAVEGEDEQRDDGADAVAVPGTVADCVM
jgi:hypothetical protein